MDKGFNKYLAGVKKYRYCSFTLPKCERVKKLLY